MKLSFVQVVPNHAPVLFPTVKEFLIKKRYKFKTSDDQGNFIVNPLYSRQK